MPDVKWTHQPENKLWELHINDQYIGLFDNYEKSRWLNAIAIFQTAFDTIQHQQ